VTIVSTRLRGAARRLPGESFARRTAVTGHVNSWIQALPRAVRWFGALE
jgi:hypothetical protein